MPSGRKPRLQRDCTREAEDTLRRCKTRLVNHIAPAFTVLFCSHHACAAHTTHHTADKELCLEDAADLQPWPLPDAAPTLDFTALRLQTLPTCNPGPCRTPLQPWTSTDTVTALRLRTSPLATLAFTERHTNTSLDLAYTPNGPQRRGTILRLPLTHATPYTTHCTSSRHC